MRYRTFLLWNFVGGALWATGVVVAGYLAGNAWRKVDSTLSLVGYSVLGAVVVAIVIFVFVRRRRRSKA
jgi:membrane protein DedA with SNARE-associated domain